MKKLLCLVGGAMLITFAFAQNHTNHTFKNRKEPFYIGNYFNMSEPVGKVINYKDTSLCLQDFKDKIVILDFWFTGCTSCINAFPEEVALQNEFADKIQIIAVTHEPEKLVRPFLEKWEKKIGEHLNFPIVVDGKSLQTAFRFRYEPHYVWIMPNGYIDGQTSSSFVTKGNIKSLIEKWKKLKALLDGEVRVKDVFAITNSK